MVSITNKEGASIEAKSLNGLMTELGLGGTRNTNAHLKVLHNEGYDLTTLDGVEFDLETLTSKTTKRRARNNFSLIERVIKQSITVDKELVKELKDEAQTYFNNLGFGEGLTIEALEVYKEKMAYIDLITNPEVSLEQVIEFITNEYNKYQEEQQEQQEEEEA